MTVVLKLTREQRRFLEDFRARHPYQKLDFGGGPNEGVLIVPASHPYYSDASVKTDNEFVALMINAITVPADEDT